MVVRGLLQYVERRRETATRKTDLAKEAHREGSAVELHVDLRGLCRWVMQRQVHAAEDVGGALAAGATVCSACFGDYAALDAGLEAVVRGLKSAHVSPTFFVDPPPGAGLLDQCCPLLLDAHCLRAQRAAEAARSTSWWAFGCAVPAPQEVLLPVLWLEQAIASLGRLGFEVAFLEAEQQAPIWNPTVLPFAIVTDNLLWCLVPGRRVVPYHEFDVGGGFFRFEGSLTSLIVRYTTCELLSEALRLRFPVGADASLDLGKLGTAQTASTPWPSSQGLRELALLCGTDATAACLQKHRIFQRLGLCDDASGAEDSVERVARWLRTRMFPIRHGRGHQLLLEEIDVIVASAVRNDPDFGRALKFQRLAIACDVAGLFELRAEWRSLRGLPPSAPPSGKPPSDLAGPTRAVAMGCGDIVLDPLPKDLDLGRHGSTPNVGRAVAGLRRLAYSCMTEQVTEYVTNPCAGEGVLVHKIRLEQSLQGKLQELWQTWSPKSRLQAFTRCTEFHLWRSRGEVGEAESIVWADPERCVSRLDSGYYKLLLQHMLTMNLCGVAGPCLLAHEVDTMLCVIGLSAGGKEPHAPLSGCETKVSQRMGSIEQKVLQLAFRILEPPNGMRLPPRAVYLLSLLEATVQGFNDLARILGVDRSDEAGETIGAEVAGDANLRQRLQALVESPLKGSPLLRLPEPKAIIGKSLLFVGLYCGGAHRESESKVPGAEFESYEESLKDLAALRSEVLYRIHDHEQGKWFKELVSGLQEVLLHWPTEVVLQRQKVRALRSSALPIDRYRMTIAGLVARHPVVLLSGLHGGGKSIRVPFIFVEPSREAHAKTLAMKRVLSVQPGPLACVAHARFLASHFGEEVGATVGYVLPDSEDAAIPSQAISSTTRLIFTTVAYLLRADVWEPIGEPFVLARCSHIIFDEAHLRSVEADLVHTMLVRSFLSPTTSRTVAPRLVVMAAAMPETLRTHYSVPAASVAQVGCGSLHLPGRVHTAEVVHLAELKAFLAARCEAPLSDESETTLAAVLRRFGSAEVLAADSCVLASKHDVSGSYLKLEPSDDENNQNENDVDRGGGGGGGGRGPGDGRRGFGSGPSSASARMRFVPKESARVVGPAAMAHLYAVQPVVAPGLLALAVELLCRLLRGGDIALVLLPTAAEVVKLSSALASELQQPRTFAGAADHVDIFAVHSLAVRFAELEAKVFNASLHADAALVVIATPEDVDAWPGIPGLRIVVDFGLRKRGVHRTRGRNDLTDLTWSARTECSRISGRISRSMPGGLCMRLFTKEFHDRRMHMTDLPHVATEPPHGAILGAIRASEIWVSLKGTKLTPSDYMELLRKAPVPLDNRRISLQLPFLHDAGAIMTIGTGQTAGVPSLTALGEIACALFPLEPRFCRLVVFGCLFGLPCDALAMAAGLSLPDPFVDRTAAIGGSDVKSPAELFASAQVRLQAYDRCDGGHLSEPLAIRGLFIRWLRSYRERLLAGEVGERVVDTAVDTAAASSSACWEQCIAVAEDELGGAASSEILLRFVLAVADLALRLEPLLPNGSARNAVQALLAILRPTDDSFRAHRVGGGQAAEVGDVGDNHGEVDMPLPENLFCPDPIRLKALLACAFSPQFMVGKVRAKASGHGLAEQRLGELLRRGFAPSRTVFVSLRPAAIAAGGVEGRLQAAIQEVCGTFVRVELSEKKDCAIIEFEDKDEGDMIATQFDSVQLANILAVNAEYGLPRTLPQAAEVLNILGSAKGGFTLTSPEKDVSQTNVKGKTHQDWLTIFKGNSPYEVTWALVPLETAEGNVTPIGKGKQSNRPRQGFCGVRGHLGSLSSCAVNILDEPEEGWGPERLPLPDPYAVFAVYAGVCEDESKSMANVFGATVMSAEMDNLLTAVLMVAFLRPGDNFECDVETTGGTIETMRLRSWIEIRPRDLGEQSVILLEDFKLINELRLALANAYEAFGVSVARGGAALVAKGDVDHDGADSTRVTNDYDEQVALVVEAFDALLQGLRMPGRACRRSGHSRSAVNTVQALKSKPFSNRLFTPYLLHSAGGKRSASQRGVGAKQAPNAGPIRPTKARARTEVEEAPVPSSKRFRKERIDVERVNAQEQHDEDDWEKVVMDDYQWPEMLEKDEGGVLEEVTPANSDWSENKDLEEIEEEVISATPLEDSCET